MFKLSWLNILFFRHYRPLTAFSAKGGYNAVMRWRKLKQKTHSKTKRPTVRYADFKERAMAFTTDIFMIGIPITLVIMILFGHDQMMHSAGGLDVIIDPVESKKHAPDPLVSIVQIVLYCAAFVLFWHANGQTPGKRMMQIKVVDAKTHETASWGNLLLRFFSYFLSAITLVGFFIGISRPDGRALHDLIAGTAVIKA